MFLKSQFKASTLCASSALLVLGGFMSVNLAGCGGGGGGGGGTFASATATPASQAITFRLVRQDMSVSNGGTVTLTSSTGTVFTATAASTGIATIASVAPGTYTVAFTVVNSAGTVLSTTTSTVTITRAAGQTFLLLQDQGISSTTGFIVSGTIRLNPGTSGTNPFLNANCTTSSTAVSDSLLVEAIDLDTTKGRPVIAQLRRSAATTNGAYTIRLPYIPTRADGSPGNFQIRISQFDVSGALFAGFSAIANFNGATTVTGLNVCVNSNGVAPVIPTTSLPTSTPTFTPVPLATATATATKTATPTPTTAG